MHKPTTSDITNAMIENVGPVEARETVKDLLQLLADNYFALQILGRTSADVESLKPARFATWLEALIDISASANTEKRATSLYQILTRLKELCERDKMGFQGELLKHEGRLL